jgi:predicted RNase H-like HicB family nuclease
MEMGMNFSIETDREVDGRWIAEVPALSGVIVYGATRAEAVSKAKALALHVIADRIDHGEDAGELVSLTFQAA